MNKLNYTLVIGILTVLLVALSVVCIQYKIGYETYKLDNEKLRVSIDSVSPKIMAYMEYGRLRWQYNTEGSMSNSDFLRTMREQALRTGDISFNIAANKLADGTTKSKEEYSSLSFARDRLWIEGLAKELINLGILKHWLWDK